VVFVRLERLIFGGCWGRGGTDFGGTIMLELPC